jgi:biotin carboxyl carrier protein
MQYYVSYEDENISLEIIDDPDGHTRVRLPDGQELAVDFDLLQDPNFFSLLVNHESHEIYVETGESRGDYAVTLDGQRYSVRVETERQHRLAALAPRTNLHTGEITVKAPMPGLVSIVAVTPGQEVEQGQRLVVLEAMKMENELKAPRSGTVKAVNVQPGQTVEQNRALVVLE